MWVLEWSVVDDAMRTAGPVLYAEVLRYIGFPGLTAPHIFTKAWPGHHIIIYLLKLARTLRRIKRYAISLVSWESARLNAEFLPI